MGFLACGTERGRSALLAKLMVVTLLAPAASRAGDVWPSWRGPTGLGHSDEQGLPLTWGGAKNENVLWKAPLPGVAAEAAQDLNQSSPIVWKDRVFVAAACWPKGTPRSAFPEHHVACYGAEDGALRWDVLVPPGPWKLGDLRGGYAAPTPCTDGERVYVLFGSSVLAALDFDGRVLWRKDVAPFAWDVAVGTSPILAGGAVLVLADGSKSELSRLIAFDAKTGQVKWERKRPEATFSHSTPTLVEVGGRPQLLVAGSAALQGLDPADGAVLWSARGKGDVPSPAFGGGLVFCYDGRGGPGMAVEPVPAKETAPRPAKWTTGPISEGFSSPTIVGGNVYLTHNPGVLRCFELATGARRFDRRLPAGVDPSISPVATADGRLYFAGGGKSVVLKVGAEYEKLAENDLGDPAPASPAVARGRLHLKGGHYLYCIRKPGATP